MHPANTWTVMKTNKITNFTNHLNSVHPSIAFMFEIDKNGLNLMVDVNLCRKEDGSLKFKDTHMDHYLQFDSHQPFEYKLGGNTHTHNQMQETGNRRGGERRSNGTSEESPQYLMI